MPEFVLSLETSTMPDNATCTSSCVSYGAPISDKGRSRSPLNVAYLDIKALDDRYKCGAEIGSGRIHHVDTTHKKCSSTIYFTWYSG